MGTVLAAFVVVFVAELGDRTQLLIVSLASRHPLTPVIGGVMLGYGLTTVASVTIGSVVGAALPERPVQVVAGLLFLAFAVWTLRDTEDTDEDEDRDGGRHGVGFVLSLAGAVVLAEIGDKSMLATATLAAERQAAVAVALGALAGILAAGLLGAVAGRLLADRVHDVVLRRAGAALFAGFGIALLVGGLR